MFWLTYAITRNRSFATTVTGITIATNWLLKKKRVELLRPIPPVQLSPTTLPGQSRTRPVGWEALLHQHSASSAPPHTQHAASQPRSWGCPSVPSSQRHSTQLERLCSNRQQTPACWKKFGRGGERVYIKNKQKTYHLSEGPRGLLEELLHFTKPLKWVKLNIAARIHLQHHMVGGTVQKNI